MADRTIKPDSGNDLVLQNNGGGTKIEIPNSGNIEITGTIGSGTFSGTISASATQPKGIPKYITQTTVSTVTEVDLISGTNNFMFDGTYDEYIIFLTNISMDSSGDLRVKVGTSSSFPGSGYKNSTARHYNGSSTPETVSQTTELLYSYFNSQNDSATARKVIIRIRDMVGSASKTVGEAEFILWDNVNVGYSRSVGKYDTNQENDRLKIYTNQTDALSCTITEYGVSYD